MRSATKAAASVHIAAIECANTAQELEAAIQAAFVQSLSSVERARVAHASKERGAAICRSSHLALYVPTFSGRAERRTASVCGKTIGVGRGNWVYVRRFLIEALKESGISQKAAYMIVDWADTYPHRCLAIVTKALAGKLPDPQLDTLVFKGIGSPVHSDDEANARGAYKRLSQACPRCDTGTIYEWGGGHQHGFRYTSWNCNRCGSIFEEHLSDKAAAQRGREYAQALA